MYSKMFVTSHNHFVCRVSYNWVASYKDELRKILTRLGIIKMNPVNCISDDCIICFIA